MGALHDLPSHDEILDRLKELARNTLPIGWRDWTLINSIDLDFEVDPSILNKLRFVLPTEGIARAFDPSATSLKEHPFRGMKVKMLSWAFCRGLVFCPSSLSMQIRGSSSSHETMMEAISSLKSSLLSREAADLLLSGSSSDIPSQRASSSKDSTTPPGGVEARLSAQEARTQRIESALEGILKELQKKNQPEQPDHEDLSCYSSDSEISSVADEWQAPAMFDDSEGEELIIEPDISFAFEPSIKELEPIVPPPSVGIEAQGIECQRLNSSGWAKIPFAEAQKEIQAGGMFSRLKINPEIEAHPSKEGELLANMDGTLGVLTHALLLQREMLKSAMKEVFKKHSAAAPVLREHLESKDSPFRKVSDCLLQFVCGKRSDVFQKRRKNLEAATKVSPKFLKEIPPSEAFLFEPKLLSDAIKNHPLSSKGRDRSVSFRFSSKKTSPSSPPRKRSKVMKMKSFQPAKKRAFEAPKGKFPKSSGSRDKRRF